MKDSDKEFVYCIINGDEQAWADFVGRYTDWVFYKANEWTRREFHYSKEKKRKILSVKTKKEYKYSEESIDVYVWIFQELRNKLHRYEGKSGASLSTYVWALLNSKYLYIDFLRWRHSNPKYLPIVIQNCSGLEQKVFVMSRMNKSENQIASELALSIDEVLAIRESLIEKLIKTGQENLILHPIEIELSEELKNIIKYPEVMTGEERILFEKVIDCFSKSLGQLSIEEFELLQLFYNQELSANEILEVYKRIEKNLPNKKAIHQSTRKDIYKIIEKIKDRLLNLFHRVCPDLHDAIINNDSINTFLEQLGVNLT